MKQALIAACLALMVGVMFIAVPDMSQAQGRGASYAKDQYYIGKGGTPPSLPAFAANPRKYLRSEAAYQSLKGGFASALGTSLSDAGFQQLLNSDQVRLVPCRGKITTAGILPNGTVGWGERDCYQDEWLIQVQTPSGVWQTVASQGCFNLVKPTPPPPPKTCRFVTTAVQQLPDTFVNIKDFNSCGCFIPGMTLHVDGGTQTSKRLVCD